MLRESDRVRLLAASHEPLISRIYRPEIGAFLAFKTKLADPSLTGKGQTAAIIDTGLMSNHPLIRKRLVDSIDFTGEGPEDENGHGTVVALILLSTAPDVELINVKCLGRSGETDANKLIEVLDWAAKDVRINVINLSAGVYRPMCTGDCSVCAAARLVSNAGKIVSVASGNLPGITACPAKASDAVITVSAIDAGGKLRSYASPATREGFVTREPDDSSVIFVGSDGSLLA